MSNNFPISISINHDDRKQVDSYHSSCKLSLCCRESKRMRWFNNNPSTRLLSFQVRFYYLMLTIKSPASPGTPYDISVKTTWQTADICVSMVCVDFYQELLFSAKRRSNKHEILEQAPTTIWTFWYWQSRIWPVYILFTWPVVKEPNPFALENSSSKNLSTSFNKRNKISYKVNEKLFDLVKWWKYEV